jgi:hypothetical protein
MDQAGGATAIVTGHAARARRRRIGQINQCVIQPIDKKFISPPRRSSNRLKSATFFSPISQWISADGHQFVGHDIS